MMLAPWPARLTEGQSAAALWPDWSDPLIWRLGSALGSVNALYFTTNAFLPDYLHHVGRADLVSAALTALNVGQIPASFLLLVVAGRLEWKIWPHVACGAGSLAAIIGIAVLPGYGIVACAAVLGFFSAAILIVMLALPPLLARWRTCTALRRRCSPSAIRAPRSRRYRAGFFGISPASPGRRSCRSVCAPAS